MEVTTRTDMSSTTTDIFAAVSFSFSVIATAISLAVAAILISSCKYARESVCDKSCCKNNVIFKLSILIDIKRRKIKYENQVVI